MLPKVTLKPLVINLNHCVTRFKILVPNGKVDNRKFKKSLTAARSAGSVQSTECSPEDSAFLEMTHSGIRCKYLTWMF